MVKFYSNWLTNGQSPLEALCNAQRAVLRGSSPRPIVAQRGLDGLGATVKDVGAPYFWAAFMLSGDWR